MPKIPTSAKQYIVCVIQDKILQLKSQSASSYEIQKAQQAYDLLLSMKEFSEAFEYGVLGDDKQVTSK